MFKTHGIHVQQGVRAFFPTNIPGLVLWLDSDDINTITESGGMVSQWDDKSGNGNNATQGMGVNQPVTGTATINSLNVLNFDGNNHQLILPRVVDTDWSIIVLYRPLVAGGSSDNWFNGDGLFDMEVSGVHPDFGLSVGLNADLLAGVQTSGSTIVKNTEGINNNYIGIFTRKASSGDIKLYVNGSVAVAGNSATGQLTGANRITIGSIQTNINYFNGHIAEVIAYDNELSSEDRIRIEQYLSNKWDEFLPSNIPGLVLWLDGADESTITLSGGLVSQWDDKSENGNNATQAMGSVQPAFISNGINGKGAISFIGGSAPFMSLDSLISETNLTAMAVFVSTETTGGGFILAASSVNNQLLRLDPDFPGPNGSLLSFDGTVPQAFFEFTSSITGILFVLRTEFEFSVNQRIYLDGVFKDDAPYNGTIQTDQIGRLLANTAGMGGRVGELLVYDRILEEDELQSIQDYIANKWIIGFSFPNVFTASFTPTFA